MLRSSIYPVRIFLGYPPITFVYLRNERSDDSHFLAVIFRSVGANLESARTFAPH